MDRLYLYDTTLRDGDIIAATFINQGKRYTALMEEYIMAGLARHKD